MFFPRALRSLSIRAVVGLLCLAAPTPVCAQRATAAAPLPAAGQPAPPVVPPVGSQQSADEIRRQLDELLREHPPIVREVLQREPALLGNADYLAPYPRLAAFVAAHPEIGRAPAYFLGEPDRQTPGGDPTWMWREMTSMLGVGALLLGAALGIGWLIRTALDHRRWQRVSRIQVDTHTKLLDRMASSEELRTYMESPAGRRFLESAPIALDGQSSPIAAPVSRILWSLQVGVVILALGIALQAVSRGVLEDAAQPLRVLGILATAVGVGFLVSAGLAYGLSRHLGLIGGDRASSPASTRS
ncbi:hypothetical protein TBR22_A45900 [Luteitalea sp. TBR-22]|nr:hypothetical protein TBR22_A45900 [Luteitalea sp. TBR-22]